MEQTLHQMVPVSFVGYLIDPIFQQALAVDSRHGDACKQDLQVAYHEVLVVQLRLADTSEVIAASNKHLAGQTIEGGKDSFANKVELMYCNHILDGRYVLEYGANFLTPYSLISY